jgi:hypothetical protein
MKTSTLIMIVVLVVVFLMGCEEQQQRRWGQGETPPEFQAWFGDSNLARLNYVQTEKMNAQNNLIYGVNETDKAGKVIGRKRGLIERIMALEDKAEKLQKPEHFVIEGVPVVRNEEQNGANKTESKENPEGQGSTRESPE